MALTGNFQYICLEGILYKHDRSRLAIVTVGESVYRQNVFRPFGRYMGLNGHVVLLKTEIII